MKSRSAVLSISSFLAGLIVVAITLYLMMPNLMIKEDISQYNFEQTTARLTENVKTAGWKLPKVYNMHEMLAKEGKQLAPVTIFELCQSDKAAQVLSDFESRNVSSMMPCRVSIYENASGEVVISRMNAGLMSYFFNQNVQQVMQQAVKETEALLQPLIK